MKLLRERPVLVGYLAAIATASFVLQLMEFFR